MIARYLDVRSTSAGMGEEIAVDAGFPRYRRRCLEISHESDIVVMEDVCYVVD